MRLAAIDIGTNSTKMTVADVSDDGALYGRLRTVGRDPAGRRRGRRPAARRRPHGPDAGRHRPLRRRCPAAGRGRPCWAREPAPCATPPTARTSSRRPKTRAGVDIQIITGDREAQLAYAAVRSDSSLGLPAEALPARLRHRRRQHRTDLGRCQAG